MDLNKTMETVRRGYSFYNILIYVTCYFLIVDL